MAQYLGFVLLPPAPSSWSHQGHSHHLGITSPNSPAALWQKKEMCEGLSHLDNSLEAGEAAAQKTRNGELG